MDGNILIVTNSHDVHADNVGRILHERGQPHFRIDLDAFPADYRLSVWFGARWTGSIRRLSTEQELMLEDIGSVWLRKAGDYAFCAPLAPQEQVFAVQETEHVLFGILHSLDCFWMSHPTALRSAQWKGEQLLRAVQFGFDIPRSLITTIPDDVRRFRAASDRDMVFKPMSSPSLGAHEVASEDLLTTGVPTTLITKAHMQQLGSVEVVPCLFQDYVEKHIELRVTVIGDRAFAAEIHSQDHELTRVDFRNFDVPVTYRAATLPTDVERRCVEFVHSYGLTFGAIDLIFSRDGRYVFLENNPGGQFMFVEHFVPELKLLDAVADCLVEGARK